MCSPGHVCHVSDILSLLSLYMGGGAAERASTDSRLTPDAVHLIDISTDNDPLSELRWCLHREALGGSKYRRNVTPGKSARRKAPPDECRVSGSSLPPLCPG